MGATHAKGKPRLSGQAGGVEQPSVSVHCCSGSRCLVTGSGDTLAINQVHVQSLSFSRRNSLQSESANERECPNKFPPELGRTVGPGQHDVCIHVHPIFQVDSRRRGHPAESVESVYNIIYRSTTSRAIPPATESTPPATNGALPGTRHNEAHDTDHSLAQNKPTRTDNHQQRCLPVRPSSVRNITPDKSRQRKRRRVQEPNGERDPRGNVGDPFWRRCARGDERRHAFDKREDGKERAKADHKRRRVRRQVARVE